MKSECMPVLYILRFLPLANGRLLEILMADYLESLPDIASAYGPVKRCHVIPSCRSKVGMEGATLNVQVKEVHKGQSLLLQRSRTTRPLL